jgi:hypothetical protein
MPIIYHRPVARVKESPLLQKLKQSDWLLKNRGSVLDAEGSAGP